MMILDMISTYSHLCYCFTVQLVPGAEVAVAPKRRKRTPDSNLSASVQEYNTMKALLRVQDMDSRFSHNYEVDRINVEVVLTSVVLMHPETAGKYSFDSLQHVVIIPRSQPKEDIEKNATQSPKVNGGATIKEVDNGSFTENQDGCQVIIRVLLSEYVAEGHVMISRSLRMLLRARLRSWVYVQASNMNVRKEIPTSLLLPCQFKKILKNQASEHNDGGLLKNANFSKPKNSTVTTHPVPEVGVIDWSLHDRILSHLSSETPCDDEEVSSKVNFRKGITVLLRSWYLAQIDAITSNSGVGVKSLVLGNKTLLHFKVKGKSLGNMNMNGSGESTIEILYILSVTEEAVDGNKYNAYELELGEESRENWMTKSLELLIGRLKIGSGVSINVIEDISSKSIDVGISSLNWMGTAASDVTSRLRVLLSPSSGRLYSKYSLPFPGHILICGPPGSGKSLLSVVAARSVQQEGDILSHTVHVCCSHLTSEKPSTLRQTLLGYISEALDHAPSAIIFDDLDSIISSGTELEGSQSSSHSVALTEFLADIMDEYGNKRRSVCGFGPIAFIACVQSLTSLPQSLSSSGRFDFHVKLPAPASAERCALLKHEIQKRSLQCSDDVLSDIASKCDGYDAYDLQILVDRSLHAGISRFLSMDSTIGEHEKPCLLKDDFLHAMHEFLPVAMRDITKPSSEGGRSGWEDVGGLNDIQNAIKEMIELPSKFPNIFAQSPLRMRSNVLLYGPPGCGKTHIVGAAAVACSLRFISVKGPELLNKYIGASEQAVRDIFSKAAAAAPCLLFFDEFDSIAPKRGHDNTGVTDRVVNQFLTELDGVEILTGVFVFAATSRPDLLDAALLRPGRLDRLLFCDFPSQNERLDILKVLSRKLPLATDVDLEAIASKTEGFSGADLQALLSDAQLEAVHDLLDNANNTAGTMPVIPEALLKSVAAKAKPSVSDTEKQRLYDIYGQFLDSKRATQSRDSKGKRATLA
ncbi:hypothetical protein Leryth_003159 [Lithospermum erythrorhizon]|nr:hypothetical protein Leryth_003159 [Lithospermum erythrorhizon]